MTASNKTAAQVLTEQGRLAPDVVAVMVGAELFDLHTPLPSESADFKIVRVNDPKALEVIRHSTAHVMADAVQKLFPGTQVTFGPATEAGFYYDFDRPGGSFSDEDLAAIEQRMAEIIAKDSPFRREELPKHEIRTLLEGMGEKYKLEHLERLEGPISLYRHGDWVDLCKGPHVPSTRFLKAFKLTSVAGAYWRGDERNPMLQRIYGTAFPNEGALNAHLKQLEQARERDHRKLGKELDLIAFHPWAPASPFFLPKGAAVYNGLVEYVRKLYLQHGYQEVVTPQIFDRELFLTSGHLPSYAENMFFAATEEDAAEVFKASERASKSADRNKAFLEELPKAYRYGVKPMNCPSHCLIFGTTRRSYRELPYRMADFGRLHRFERSGVVQGLTRVRTFAQDDAHIFCTIDQVQEEISRFVDLVYSVYRDFAFEEPRFVVALRPEKRIGSDEVWDKAEDALLTAARSKGVAFEVAEGEGAFYGPKIEFHLKDAIGRSWQLGTIQADFNMPERFGLTYIGEDNAQHRPVMLHRAILGSIERFFGVLLEHVGGAFPTWLAPEQIALVTVSEKFNDYAQEVEATLRRAGHRVTVDLSSDKLGAKIRNARLTRVPYIGVIGQKEVEGRGVALRSRDENKELGLVTLDALLERLRTEGSPPSQRAS